MCFDPFKKSIQQSGRLFETWIIVYVPNVFWENLRLYSFAPRKAKERWPVDNLHLGIFNCDMFLVLRLNTLNLKCSSMIACVS